MYPQNYYFTKDHEWVDVDGDTATVGISDFAQKQLGDVVYVELPEIGKHLDVHQTIGTIESVKAVSEVFSPVSGRSHRGHTALNNAPEYDQPGPPREGLDHQAENEEPGRPQGPDEGRRLREIPGRARPLK